MKYITVMLIILWQIKGIAYLNLFWRLEIVAGVDKLFDERFFQRDKFIYEYGFRKSVVDNYEKIFTEFIIASAPPFGFAWGIIYKGENNFSIFDPGCLTAMIFGSMILSGPLWFKYHITNRKWKRIYQDGSK